MFRLDIPIPISFFCPELQSSVPFVKSNDDESVTAKLKWIQHDIIHAPPSIYIYIYTHVYVHMSYGFFWNDEIYTKGNFLIVA